MSIIGSKILDEDIETHGIVGKPDKLPGPASDNKRTFDELVREVIVPRLNSLIDALLAAAAAGEIGVDNENLPLLDGQPVATTQEALEALQEEIQGISQGFVAEDSIETEMLKDNVVTKAKLDTELDYTAVNLTDEQVVPIYVTDTPPTSASGDGIYLVYEE